MPADKLLGFAKDIKSEIEYYLEEYPEDTRETALASYYIQTLLELQVINEPQGCQHSDIEGRNRCAVTAYCLYDDDYYLDLFLSYEFESEEELLASVSKGKLTELAYKATRFFDYVVSGKHERFESNERALDAAQKIHEVKEKIKQVRIILLTDAIAKDRNIEVPKIEGFDTEVQIYDITRLFRIVDKGSVRADLYINFEEMLGAPLPCLEMKPRPVDYQTYIAIFPGNLIYDLYESYGQQLLEFNVRSFLQARGKVNKGIRDTLEHEPERFMAYNNGLTATVDEIEIGMFHGETAIKSMTGLQIVNGGQTTASIHRAKKRDNIDVSKVSVAVKITKVAEEKLDAIVPLISRYANTQNVIQVADLSANNPFHVAIERLANTTWCPPSEETKWFYERARGSYQVALNREGTTPAKKREFKKQIPASNKFIKTDLAKWYMTWQGRPHQVSAGAQKNFAMFMDEIDTLLQPDWIPDEDFYKKLIAKGIIFKKTHSIVTKLKIPAYRANVVTYLGAYLSYRCEGEINFNLVWQKQNISEELRTLLVAWAPQIHKEIIRTAGDRNVTEWCKKTECWKAIKSLQLELPQKLPPELSLDTEQEEEDTEEAQEGSIRIDRDLDECRKLDGLQWNKISLWGRETGKLITIEYKVARTMGDYADQGWDKLKPNLPSGKQVRIASKALKIAKENNVIE